MMQNWHMKMLAGVAILGLSAGGALAQDSYSHETTQRSVDAYGNTVERTDSYQQQQAPIPGGSRTVRTESHSMSTDGAPGAVIVDPDDEDVADAPYPPAPDAPPMPPPAPPSSVTETTTTRSLDNGGVQTDSSRHAETNQAFIDENGQLSAHTTTKTDTHSSTITPPTRVIPPPVAAPDSVTTTTTTTRVNP